MLRATLLILLGVASFASVYAIMAPTEPSAIDLADVETDPVTVEPDGVTAPEPRVIEIAAIPSVAPVRVVRDVTTAEITALPTQATPPTRVDPAADETVSEVGEQGVAVPPTTEPAAEDNVADEARMARVFNPVIESAELILAGDRDIQLAGINAPDAEETCGAEDWPCGRMARAALRRFVRGRAIECEVPAGAADIPDAATCLVGGENISEWLVAQGWAEATGEAYLGIEMSARQDGLGMWAERRPDGQEDIAAGDPASSPDNAVAINARVSATP